MRVLCVARHEYLSAHFCRYFSELGLESFAAVGAADAEEQARVLSPDVVVWDYDLLATTALAAWEHDPTLSTLAVVAVSLTRRPDEASMLDANGIGGFLYLPTLDADSAMRLLRGARRRRGVTPPGSLSWPGASPVERPLHP
ncbi:MAG: hypothetical protein JWO05_126 [Gemmatimonadetes bacterium]|nr:hypothetical protein [Gemmatimonadota bacterium]